MVVQSAARVQLHGESGDGRPIHLDLNEGEVTIGRAPGSGFQIDDPRVSRSHATVRVTPHGVSVHDLGSTNGTYLNGERVTEAEVQSGDQLSLGGLSLMITIADSGAAAAAATRVDAGGPPMGGAQTLVAASAEGTVILEPRMPDSKATRVLEAVAAEPAAPPARQRGVVSDDMLRAPVISEAELIANGIDVTVVPCASIGGGMGSFVWTDLLRVSGVPAEGIAVVSNEQHSYGRYQRLCQNSQIPGHERLRSNSDSRPDNVWGFPGYAASEAWGELKRGHVGTAFGIYRKIFGEPAVGETFTPRSGIVFAALEKEETRIGWPRIVRFGRARAIRKTAEGRLLVIASASDETTRRHYAISAQFLHVSVGYPSIQLLPDLADYREKYDERTRVVNAYEQHDHIYKALKERGGTVLLRGRGIVASRIIQRLYEERGRGSKITIVHLHRSKLTEGHHYGRSRRQVISEFEFQPFNWPKSAWTGEQRVTMERASPEERKHLLEVWGGTTTADRHDWQRMTREGLHEGWYRTEYGIVKDMTPGADGRVISHIGNSLAGGGVLELAADYVIDCTGLIASPERSPLMGDLLATYGLAKNPYGRLHVTNDFEVEGMRHGNARMYACGAITLGGPHAAVDSFLGLQYACYRAVTAMQRHAPDHIRKLNGMYSVGQWRRWRKGVAP